MDCWYCQGTGRQDGWLGVLRQQRLTLVKQTCVACDGSGRLPDD